MIEREPLLNTREIVAVLERGLVKNKDVIVFKEAAHELSGVFANAVRRIIVNEVDNLLDAHILVAPRVLGVKLLHLG